MGSARTQAKASWIPGTLYAVDGGEGWIYYGQVSASKGNIGFLRHRTRDLDTRPEIPAYPLMSRICIAWPSLGRALAGQAVALAQPCRAAFRDSPARTASLCARLIRITCRRGMTEDRAGQPGTILRTWHTRIDDPEIQNFEVMSVWDAEHHLPGAP